MSTLDDIDSRVVLKIGSCRSRGLGQQDAWASYGHPFLPRIEYLSAKNKHTFFKNYFIFISP